MQNIEHQFRKSFPSVTMHRRTFDLNRHYKFYVDIVAHKHSFVQSFNFVFISSIHRLIHKWWAVVNIWEEETIIIFQPPIEIQIFS